jgi:hypothetical protein
MWVPFRCIRLMRSQPRAQIGCIGRGRGFQQRFDFSGQCVSLVTLAEFDECVDQRDPDFDARITVWVGRAARASTNNGNPSLDSRPALRYALRSARLRRSPRPWLRHPRRAVPRRAVPAAGANRTCLVARRRQRRDRCADFADGFGGTMIQAQDRAEIAAAAPRNASSPAHAAAIHAARSPIGSSIT